MPIRYTYMFAGISLAICGLILSVCSGAHEEDMMVNLKQNRNNQEKQRATRKFSSSKITPQSQSSKIDSLSGCSTNLKQILTPVHASCCLLRTTCYRYKCNVPKSDCDSLFRTCAEAKCIALEDPDWCAKQWKQNDGIAIRILHDTGYLGLKAWKNERRVGGCSVDEPHESNVEEARNVKGDLFNVNDRTKIVQDDVERLLADLGIHVLDENNDGSERNVIIQLNAHRDKDSSKGKAQNEDSSTIKYSRPQNSLKHTKNKEETNDKLRTGQKSSLSIVDVDLSMHSEVQEALKKGNVHEYRPPVMESIFS